MRRASCRRRWALLPFLLAAATPLAAQHGPPPAGEGRTGLLHQAPGAYEGFTLFTPLSSTTTYLVDMAGEVVHSWESEYRPGQSAYLLANGNLLRAGRAPGVGGFEAEGRGGVVQELGWDSTVRWEYAYGDGTRLAHHDIEPLPNGNVLLIAWEKKTRNEAVAAGRNPNDLEHGELWPDHLVEIQPVRPDAGRVVWEWHVWDHLVQDRDPEKPAYGVVADHPELVDVNAASEGPRSSPDARFERAAVLRHLAEGNESPAPTPDSSAAWNRANSVDYNGALDQILLSVPAFGEIWVIDHGTTSEEAAGHEGGRWGRGGDLLYRWGNPAAYGRGTADDQQLFEPHDARWIRSAGGAWSVLVFNSGAGRADGSYSSVDQILLPFDESAGYAAVPEAAHGPREAFWTYTATRRGSFFSARGSGAQRLPNGNTLTCVGEQGHFVEVTPTGQPVWDYVQPFGASEGVAGSGVFRATRLSPKHPGLALLAQRIPLQGR